MDAERTTRRDRSLEVTPLATDRFGFTGRLTDQSRGGDHEPSAPSAVIHDFVVRGEVEGHELRLTRLEVEAVTHPYPQCPFILPVCDELVGASLSAGWRRAVLDRLRGAAGCTHVVSLLLSLTELTTLTFFLRINESLPYGESTRADGSWMAVGREAFPSLTGACHVLSQNEPMPDPLTPPARTQPEEDPSR